MINLATVVTLLQVALGLLGNPAIQGNAQLQAQASQFAAQAIAMAGLALSNPITVPHETPVLPAPVVPPIIQEAPQEVPVVPSCTLASDAQTASGLTPASVVTLSWTLTNMPTSSVGTLYTTSSVATGGHLAVQDSGPFPGLMQTNVYYSPGGFIADFSGVRCSAYFDGH